jgi:hypothetical protein
MFKNLKDKVQQQFNTMRDNKLFVVGLDKDTLFQAYLSCFPEEERQEHNCNCCKQFLRNFGGLVAIVNNEVKTMWEFEVEEPYNLIPQTLDKLVREAAIANLFVAESTKLGTDFNLQRLEDNQVRRWEHFFVTVPQSHVRRGSDSIEKQQGEYRTSKEVLQRGLEELSMDSVVTVLELIAQNSLYRGEEHKAGLEVFKTNKEEYDSLSSREKECFAWPHAGGNFAKIRNTSIGILLIDLSKGMDLERAVNKFETMVAPQNYKRPTAIVTKAMLERAEQTLKDLGLERSIYRRHAVPEDINVQNFLFVNRETPRADIFSTLKEEVKVNPKQFDKIEEVPIDRFIEEVLPLAESIDVLLENKHTNHFMSLTAPVYPDSPSLFKWDNQIGWSYVDGFADSMKERVKAAGGKVEGALRFSIQWNDNGDNNIDFDAHAIEPDGYEISFSNKGRRSSLTGMLDVDIISPGGKVAVENIIWDRTPFGVTTLFVHNYSSRNSNGGFTAEIEYEGQVYSYSYDKPLRGGEKVTVAVIDISSTGLKFKQTLDNNTVSISKDVWGVSTNQFQKVSMVLNSPNHWGEVPVGNKHLFFILDKAKNPTKPRGIFNEFLRNDLNEHRKVFELLGSKIEVQQADRQLSGLGFSLTQRDSIILRVTGKTQRVIKVNI